LLAKQLALIEIDLTQQGINAAGVPMKLRPIGLLPNPHIYPMSRITSLFYSHNEAINKHIRLTL
jgi:hypothetical protein